MVRLMAMTIFTLMVMLMLMAMAISTIDAFSPQLWQAVIEAGLQVNCARCNFQVGFNALMFLANLIHLFFCIFALYPLQCLDWNTSSIEFYERAGAVNLSKVFHKFSLFFHFYLNQAEGWLSFRMNREVMQAFLKK